MIYKILAKNFWKNAGWKYIIGIVLLFAINALLLYVPKLIGYAIDSIANHRIGLTKYILIFIGIVLLLLLLKCISRHLVLGSIRHLEHFLRRLIFNQALTIPVSYFEKNGPGKVMALMTNDVMSVRLALGLGLFIFVDALFFGLFSIIIMGHQITYERTLLTISPMVPIILTTLFLSRFMRKQQKEAQTSFSTITEFVQELFWGLNVIRAFNKERKVLFAFQKLNRQNYDKNMAVALLDAIIGPLTYIAPFACYALNIYISGPLVIHREISIGDFIAMNGYLILLIGPLMSIGALATVTQKGLASMERIGDFLEIEKEPFQPSEKALPLGNIEIKNLSFSYEGTTYNALKNISMMIPPGTFVGIVGGPGSGKTTLFKLLLGLQSCPLEKIFIDNRDICHIPMEELRRGIAYVPQQSFILHSTVKDNITFGELNSPLGSVEEAAQKASIDLELGDRIKDESSKLKEGGKDLSGGQKQRINIARAIYKNAPYLLLDDAFSALDFKTGKEILSLIEDDQSRTILFISQRLEALVNAHIIYVFRDGCIMEQGTHKELMALQGEYYRLYNQQIKGGTTHDDK